MKRAAGRTGRAGKGVIAGQHPGAAALLDDVDFALDVAGVIGDRAADAAVAGPVEVEVTIGGGGGGDGGGDGKLAGVALNSALGAAGHDGDIAAQGVGTADAFDGNAAAVARRKRDGMGNRPAAVQFQARAGADGSAGAGDVDGARSEAVV